MINDDQVASTMMMTMIEPLVGRGSLLNVTTIDFPASGILFTFTVNVIVCSILFLLFICFLQPCLPIFNVSRKKRLMKRVKREMTLDLEQKHVTRRGTNLKGLLSNNSNIERTSGNSRLDDSAVIFPEDVTLLEDIAEEDDIEQQQQQQQKEVVNSPTDELLNELDAEEEKLYSHMLDLNQEETEYDQFTNYSSLSQFASTNPLYRKFRNYLIVLRELCVYIWRVFLSFFCHKQNLDDMKHLTSKYSRDVAVYLLFQKEIILALGLCAFLASCILLPLHLTGKEPVYEYQYEYGTYNLTREDYPLLRTSVSMVITSPEKLYTHVILCFIFVVIFYVFLHRFRTAEVVTREHFLEEQLIIDARKRGIYRKKKLKKTQLVSIYSVKLYNLPRDFPSQRAFDKMVREELCPDLKIFKTVLMLNFVERIELQKKYKYYCDMVERYIYLEEYSGKSPVTCFCSFRNGIRKLDAIEYYREKMEDCELQMREWEDKYKKVLADDYDETTEDIYPAGYGFVVFENPEHAQQCLNRYYKRGTITKPIRAISNTTNNEDKNEEILRTVSFKVAHAYEPNDINWNNMLTYAGCFDNFRNIFIQLAILSIFIFFTSPLAALSGLQSLATLPALSSFTDKIKGIFNRSGHVGTAIFQYLPTLMLHIFSIGMPYVIWYMSEFSKYRSKSRYNRKLMSRMYIYLVLSTLLMPSMLLTSFDAVLTYLKDKENIRQMFTKAFVPASGAFFINYVIQSALLKNFGDIIRVVNILNFVWGVKHWPYTTPKEVLKACELSEFYFEYEYPYMISVLAMVLCYSVFCPVILFMGLAYMILKHLIDRYVIMYIYGHKKHAARGVLSFDFKAHKKQTDLVSQLMLMNIVIFLMAMTIFYATKVQGSSALLPHTIIVATFLGVVTLVWLLEYANTISVLSFFKTRFIQLLGINSTAEVQHSLLSQEEISKSQYGSGDDVKEFMTYSELDIYADPRFIRAYEPPFSFVKDFKTWSQISVEKSVRDKRQLHKQKKALEEQKQQQDEIIIQE
jgi:hypothetical protein